MRTMFRCFAVLVLASISVTFLSSHVSKGEDVPSVDVFSPTDMGEIQFDPADGDPALLTGCGGSVGPDVIVGDVVVNSSSNYASVGSIDAFSWGTTSCNQGTENLNWQAGNPNHPVIPQNMYRLKTVNGAARFEQIGLGWMKHGFTALTGSLCCSCSGQGGNVLGVGCSDPYTASRNGEQCPGSGGCGPRFQTNPHTGDFVFPFMFRQNCSYIPHTSITRRCQVLTSDLDPALNPGALYYAEAQYVTPDDADAGNQDNNCSYKRITISAGSAASAEATRRELPAIKAWKTADPSVTETTISTPEATNPQGVHDATGTCILSAKATLISGDVYRYEYALFNMNSDRCISSFSIPVSNGLTVTNIGFHDVFYHDGDGFNSNTTTPVNFDGTDWPGAHGAGAVSWSIVAATPVENSNVIRWGTLYNFRFDCNAAPVSGQATLGLFKAVAGQPNSIGASTVVPTPSVPCNDPVIAAIPGQGAACNVPFTYNVSAGGTPPFDWSLSGAPSGMTIDSNGQISWPSPVISSYEIGVTAASMCGSGSHTESLILRVLLGDFDGDGSVTLSDTDLFASHLVGNTSVSDCAADVNQDGALDGLDIDKYLEMLGLTN